MIQHFTKKLEEWGVDKTSLTRGTIIFGAVAGTYILALWSFCYFLSPTKYIIERLPWKSGKEMFSKAKTKAESTKFLKKIPEHQRGRLSISFGEMLILKTALGPVALPFKVWLTIKLAKMTQSSSP